MKKIMFNDKYGLTKAVLEGRKTQTRRILKCPKKFGSIDVSGFRVCTNSEGLQFVYLVDEDEREIEGSVNAFSAYRVGEYVAVAQNYKDAGRASYFFGGLAGWTNKMFVEAEEMPRYIKITNVRVERLQDISEEDCLKEGVEKCGTPTCHKHYCARDCDDCAPSPKEAFAVLIDKVSGKGTWESNPWVFVYDFELTKQLGGRTMNDNIKEILNNAKFGDRFKTRNGRMLIFWFGIKKAYSYCLIGEGCNDRFWYNHNEFCTGTLADGETVEDLDIIDKWEDEK